MEKANEDEPMDLFVHYMAYWFLGVKLIFIFLLIVVCCVGNKYTQIGATVAMILSIATYFFKLHPIMIKLDKQDQLTPKGYSKTLM